MGTRNWGRRDVTARRTDPSGGRVDAASADSPPSALGRGGSSSDAGGSGAGHRRRRDATRALESAPRQGRRRHHLDGLDDWASIRCFFIRFPRSSREIVAANGRTQQPESCAHSRAGGKLSGNYSVNQQRPMNRQLDVSDQSENFEDRASSQICRVDSINCRFIRAQL